MNLRREMELPALRVTTLGAAAVSEPGGVAAYEVTVQNEMPHAVEAIISLDIYPAEAPKHPNRHLGYWNWRVTFAPGATELMVKLRFPSARLVAGGKESEPDDVWLGTYRENGLYGVRANLYDGNATESVPAMSGVDRMQLIVLDRRDVRDVARRHWPQPERRYPPLSMADYITLKSISEMVAEFVDKDVRRGARVLDVGCGYKPYYPFFAEKDVEYVGADLIDSGFVDVLAEADRLPFEDASFDAVISTQVFEHIPEPALTAKEIYRVLKPGGAALITIPFVWEQHDWPHDYWRFTADGIRRLLADFDELDIRPNGSSIQCLVQSYNNIIYRRFGKPDTLTLPKRFLFRTDNYLARLFTRAGSDRVLTANYTVVARKRSAPTSFVEDFVRVYPDGLVFDESGRKRPATEEDRRNYLNHQKVYGFAAQFAPGKVVADLGCGCGHGSHLLKESGARAVYGCDMSSNAIEFARARYGDSAEFSVRSVTDLRGYETDSFDVVVSCEVLEHLKESGSEEKAVLEMRRVTKPGGLILIGTPNAEMIAEHGFSFEETETLMKRHFKRFLIFENALAPFGEQRRLWDERRELGRTGVVVSERIRLDETVVPADTEPELKRGIEPGRYEFGPYRVDTTLLHNTHSWMVLAMNDKGAD